MGNEKITDFDSTDIRTIDRLITHFERRHTEAFPYSFPIPDSDYATDLENRRLNARLRGAVACLNELKQAILSSETSG